MFRVFLFPILLCAYTTHAGGTFDQSNISLDRASAINWALSHNLGLKAARLEISRAQARSTDAGKLSNPELSLSGSSDFAFNDEGENTWSAGLSQSFPITDRLRLLRSIAEIEINLARLEIQNAERALTQKVELNYDSTASLDKEIEALQKQIELNQHLKDILNMKVDRAEASALDVRQLDLMTATIKQKERTLKRDHSKIEKEWRQLLTLPPTTPIQRSADSRKTLPTVLPPFTETDLRSHPAYTLKEQITKLNTTQLELAHAQRWADITVEIFFEEENSIDEPSGLERERFFGIGVSIPLPLRDSNSGERENQKIRQQQLQMELDDLRINLLSDAESMRQAYADLQLQIQDFENSLLSLASKNLGELENAYYSGKVELTTLFRAR